MTNVVALMHEKIKIQSEYIEISNVYEMCRFVQSEIRASKMKYVDIARRSGVTAQTVSRIASGETKDPRTGTIIKILLSLGRRIYVK